MPPRVLAVDWSGAKKGARRKIWLAEVADGRLRRLESGRYRAEVVKHLISEAEEDPRLVVGLDFAFSFPRWFLDQHGLESGPEVRDRVADSGEEWLAAAAPPSSEDALDAPISAVVMARHLDEIEALEAVEDPVLRKEGVIWWPSGAARQRVSSSRARSDA